MVCQCMVYAFAEKIVMRLGLNETQRSCDGDGPYTIAIERSSEKFNTIEYNAYGKQPSIYLYNMPQIYQCIAARQLPTAQRSDHISTSTVNTSDHCHVMVRHQILPQKLLPNTEQPNYDRGSITELSAASSTITAPSANNSSGVFTRTSMTRMSV